MKRTAIFLVLLLAVTSPAVAAPKSVTVKKLNLIAVNQDVEKLVISGKTIIAVGNTDGPNSNILLTGLDRTGLQLWQKTIDSDADEVVLAAATDSSGNIWLAGASSVLLPTESATVSVEAENPDGVVIEPITKLRSDMNLLTLWKVSSEGDLIATYTNAQSTPALINAISVNNAGISLVGTIQERPFIKSANTDGVFSKTIYIGTSKSSLNAIVRHTDGSLSVFGSSSETLGGKKLVGRRDGVLIKVSITGTITTVVRSSGPKADRAWLSADPSLALSGYVKIAKVTETAITKFNLAFVPTWTKRVPSVGPSTVLSVGAITYGALSSQSPVAGILGWKPVTPSLLVLTFDNKGLLTGAYGSSDVSEPISMNYSKELGLVGLARLANQSLTLFTIA